MNSVIIPSKSWIIEQEIRNEKKGMMYFYETKHNMA